MDFKNLEILEGPKSPKYSKGFEPLFVEEDEDYERREFEMNERLCSMMMESVNDRDYGDIIRNKDDKNNNDNEEEEEDESDLDEIDLEESPGTDHSDEEESRTSSSEFPTEDDAHRGSTSISTITDFSKIQSTSDSGCQSSSQSQNYGLQKMPSYEFKFRKNSSGNLDGNFENNSSTTEMASGQSNISGATASTSNSLSSPKPILKGLNSTGLTSPSSSASPVGLIDGTKINKTSQESIPGGAETSGITEGAAFLTQDTSVYTPKSLTSSNMNNAGESKMMKNKMSPSSSSSGLFSGLGVKNPISAFGASLGKTIGNLSGNSSVGTSNSNSNFNTTTTSGNGKPGLPPIPPNSVQQPIKPARASLTVGSKTRLKSPSRKQHSITLDDFPVGTNPSSFKISGGKKKPILAGKRYASSLPDQERNKTCSPVAFDINSFLCHNQGPIDFSALLGRKTQPNYNAPPTNNNVYRGHAKPTKNCKNKHMWARTSIDRDIFSATSPQSGTSTSGATTTGCNSGINSDKKLHCRGGATSPISSNSNAHANNRHSSYHPSFGGVGGLVSDSAAAAAAAAAAAYNAHMFFSRPTSPLFLDSSSYCSNNTGAGDFGPFCPSCAVKTFPRARSNAHHGLCHCCHQQNSAGVGVNSSNLLGGSLLGLDYEDRLLRLESDKETLHLQVSCLSDQIEAQTDKIKDLEKLLDDKRNVLETTEEQLHRELLTRSTLETQKLELLTEISSLRLKHASLERENVELKERMPPGKSTGDLSYLDGAGRIWDKPPLVPINGSMRSGSPSQHHDQRSRLGSNGSEHGGLMQQPPPPNRVRTPPANAYRRVEQSAFGTVPRRSPHSSQLSTFNGQLSTAESQHGTKSGKSNSLSSGNINVITNFNNGSSCSQQVPAHVPVSMLNPRHASFHQQTRLPSQVLAQNNTFYPSGQHPFHDSIGFGRDGGYQSVASSGGGGSVIGGESSSSYGAYGSSSHSSSTKHSNQPCNLPCVTSSKTNPNSGSRSTSTPNLAGMDKQDWERNKSSGNIGNLTTNGKTKQSPSGGGHKSRGILRILGKLRRSNSGGLDNDQIAPAEVTAGPFTRGGLRATAQPRLGWVKEPSPPKKPDGPITSWDSDSVIMWLNYIGLAMYSGDVKRWVKTGQQLLDASPHELEKELGVKNHLHRKKLILALTALKHPNEEDNAGKLDYHWVIRWLDDVGLPQYKETFGEARVDGRVLSYLTADDLVTLKVTSVLHHASIKRGIQLLRIHKFHPDCLCRRGGPTPGFISRGSGSEPRLGNNNGSNGSGDYGSSDGSSGGNLWGPKQVATWTNHRVMEWLRAIDLAEYAPNLRGSGVHGALIIFEVRFNSELIATLLSIPGNKTLLRRHLSLQLNELVGKHIVQEKRTAELAQDFIPINPTTKVKITKKSQFPLRKKRLSTDFASEELLSPVDLAVNPFPSDSVGQLSTLEISLDGTPGGDKVSNI